LYHIVAYLVSMDKLFDDQAKLLRQQISQPRASRRHSEDAPNLNGSS
jgi:hypothetical protein